MKQKVRSVFILILLGGLIIVNPSCDGGIKYSNKIKVSPREVEITAKEYFFELEVTTEAGWTVKSNKDWIVPYYELGFGNTTLSVDYQYNDQEEERTAKLTFEADGDEIDVIVTQEAGGIFDCYLTHSEEGLSKIDYTYDSNNRVISYIEEKGSSTYVFTFTYNSGGNISRIDEKRDGVLKYNHIYDYNSDGDLIFYKEQIANSSDKIFSFTLEYNSKGLPSIENIDFSELPDLYKKYTYNSSGDLIKELIYFTDDNSLLNEITYTYDDKKYPNLDFPNWKKQKHNILTEEQKSHGTDGEITIYNTVMKYYYNVHGYPESSTADSSWYGAYTYNCPSE